MLKNWQKCISTVMLTPLYLYRAVQFQMDYFLSLTLGISAAFLDIKWLPKCSGRLCRFFLHERQRAPRVVRVSQIKRTPGSVA